ncbi:MAG: PLDc N-terminal domain-containing protein, partial [Bdellovibrionota bacterium]
MSTWSYVLIVFYPIAFLCAGRAIMRSRTPQGATAWTVALLSFPIISVPCYLVFGRSKFNGYLVKRKTLDRRARDDLAKIERLATEDVPPPTGLEEVVAATLPSK